jgi:protein-tyrosine-phosphatase/DNA-binding transcriptional ArsR family regulator
MYCGVVGPSSEATPAFVRLAAHPLRWRLLTELAQSDRRVRELVALVGEPQNLVSYHLRLLRDGGLVTAARSSFDGRDSYYHLDLDRCADALAAPRVHLRRSPRVGVLFVCTGNTARSPIAEALLRHRTGGRAAAVSAGSRPGTGLHPDALRVLRDEFGIDLAGQRPRHLDSVAARRFDYVISLCDKAREACPEFPGRPRRLHWSIPDPAAEQGGYPAFRRIAATIDARIKHLLPVLAAAREGNTTT